MISICHLKIVCLIINTFIHQVSMALALKSEFVNENTNKFLIKPKSRKL